MTELTNAQRKLLEIIQTGNYEERDLNENTMRPLRRMGAIARRGRYVRISAVGKRLLAGDDNIPTCYHCGVYVVRAPSRYPLPEGGHKYLCKECVKHGFRFDPKGVLWQEALENHW